MFTPDLLFGIDSLIHVLGSLVIVFFCLCVIDNQALNKKEGSPQVEVLTKNKSSVSDSVDVHLTTTSMLGSREGQPFVKAENLSASWSYEDDKLVLDSLSFEVNQDSRLLAVVGPVGAGKVPDLKDPSVNCCISNICRLP